MRCDTVVTPNFKTAKMMGGVFYGRKESVAVNAGKDAQTRDVPLSV